jgi:beta-glucosidase
MALPAAPAGLLGESQKFGIPLTPWSARWTGTLTPPVTGLYTFSLSGSGTAALYLDNQRVTSFERTDFPNTSIGSIQLTAGRPVQVLINYDNASVAIPSSPRLGWEPPSGRLERAVAAAKNADVVIVFVGEQLGEGYDKHYLALPGDQNNLIEAVSAANPRTVVVLHTSTAVAMPWIDKIAAVVAAWYPGQEAGSAIAALLFGDENPSGKLPMTFPRDESQGAVSHWMRYPGDGRNMQYDEGVFVGHRWYDANDQEPLFPLGHGLSYTKFQMSGLRVKGAGDRRVIELDVANLGQRDGSEVVQVYIGMPSEAGEPPQVLKGFEKVAVPVGAKRHVKIALPDSELAIYDESGSLWRVVPGTYKVLVGASSRDIRQHGEFEINSVN